MYKLILRAKRRNGMVAVEHTRLDVCYSRHDLIQCCFDRGDERLDDHLRVLVEKIFLRLIECFECALEEWDAKSEHQIISHHFKHVLDLLRSVHLVSRILCAEHYEPEAEIVCLGAILARVQLQVCVTDRQIAMRLQADDLADLAGVDPAICRVKRHLRKKVQHVIRLALV